MKPLLFIMLLSSAAIYWWRIEISNRSAMFGFIATGIVIYFSILMIGE